MAKKRITTGSKALAVYQPARNVIHKMAGGMRGPGMLIQSVTYVTLPTGIGPSHLCFEQCGPFVHVSHGAPLLLADFRDAPVDGKQAKLLMKRDGSWPDPLLYRSVRVERIEPGPVLWGPVQPLSNAPSI